MHTKVSINQIFTSLLAILIMSTSGCTFNADNSNTPIGVSRKLFDSMQANDANKYLDAITPQDRQQPNFFFSQQLVQAVYGIVGLDKIDASKIRFTNMSYQLVDSNNDVAHVAVQGKIRDLNFAQEQSFSETLTVLNIDGTWLVSLGGDAEIQPTATQGVVVGRRDATPPKTPEQIAAADAFQQYSISQSFLYQNARYNTTQNDNSFATVVITFELVQQDILPLEASGTVNLRYIGGSWKADQQNITVNLTAKGQATSDAIDQATTVANNQQEKATADAIQASLGGTIIYIPSNDSNNSNYHQIAVRKVDGTIDQFDPLANIANAQDYESLDQINLSSDGKSIYFSAEIGDFEPTLFVTDLSGANTTLIKKFGNQRFFESLAVSPDNQEVAVIVGSFLAGGDELWLIPTTAGNDGKSLLKGDQNNNLISLTWNSDSKSIYALSGRQADNNQMSYHLMKFDLNGNSSEIGQYPTDYTDNHLMEKAFSLSPDGQDIILGWGGLGLLHLADGTLTNLTQTHPVCNPKWVKNGNNNRIVFASENNIMVYDVKDGTLTNPLTIPSSMEVEGLCPLYDWVP